MGINIDKIFGVFYCIREIINNWLIWLFFNFLILEIEIVKL